MLLYFDREIFLELTVLRAKFFIENIKMYIQSISFLDTDMTQQVEIFYNVKQELTYST